MRQTIIAGSTLNPQASAWGKSFRLHLAMAKLLASSPEGTAKGIAHHIRRARHARGKWIRETVRVSRFS